MPQVICLGEALIDFVSTAPVASVADAPSFVPAAGGSPANAAVAFGRLGVPTGFVGKVGDDPFGRLLGRIIAANGVDVSRLLYDAAARTALAFVALDEVGHPDFVFFRHPSADMLLRESDLDASYIAGAQAFHTGSIVLAAEPSRSATIAALRLAKASGLLVSLDPNVRLSVWRDADELRETLLPLFALADVVKLSEEDLGVLLGDPDARRGAAAVLARGARLVVVTRGENGCLGVTREREVEVPGYVVPVVETTGAGDAFLAGLITGLLAVGATPTSVGEIGERDLLAVLRLANGVGALTTTGRGAIPSLPTRAALRAFLAERGESAAAALIG